MKFGDSEFHSRIFAKGHAGNKKLDDCKEWIVLCTAPMVQCAQLASVPMRFAARFSLDATPSTSNKNIGLPDDYSTDR